MFDLKVLHRPTSPDEAVRLFAETEGSGLYIGGGTVVVPAGSPKLSYLVDLSDAGLDDLSCYAGALSIGATVTVANIASSPDVAGIASGLLRVAALSVANHTVRNLATVGGNVAAWPYPTDLPVALLVLDTSLDVQDASGRRDVSLSDFLTRRGEVFEKGDLIVELKVPAASAGLAGGFDKIGRKKLDVAIVNAAAAMKVEEGSVADVRVALGGGGAAPARLPACESFLEGKGVSEELFDEAGRIASSGFSPRGDHRAGAAYRTKVSAIAVKRALLRAAGLAQAQR